MGATGKSLQEQLSSAGAAAEAALESGVDAVSTTVRSGLAAAKSETAAARSRLQQVYDTGAAHLEATEEQALGLLRQGVQYVRVEHPDASLAGAAALAALLLPGPRRFLLRNTLGRCVACLCSCDPAGGCWRAGLLRSWCVQAASVH